MYCSFCGKEIADGSVFCSECGRNLTTGKKSIDLSNIIGFLSRNKKYIISAIAVILAIVLGISWFGSKSINGVWMSGTTRIVFSKDGSYSSDVVTGTYYIDDDKTLIIDSDEDSYLSGCWEYEYGKEAKERDGYWYISGNTLYIEGNDYKRVK